MALDLDPSHLPTLGGAPADRDRQRRLRQGRAVPRPGAELHDGAARSARELLVELGKLRDEMLGEHDSAVLAWEAALRGGRRERGRGAAARRRVHRAARAGRRPSRSSRCSSARRASASAASSTTLQNKLGMVCAALGKDDKALKAYTAAHQLDLTDQATIRGLAEVCFRLEGLGRRAHQLPEGAHGARRGRDRGARQRLLQARLHQARAGAGQAGDQQLREGARRRRRAPADARGAGRALRRAQGLEAGRRLQAADPRQRLRRRRALQDAQRDRRRLERQGQEPAKAHRGARGGARSPAAEPRAPPQAPRALPGDRELGEDDRHHPGHRRHGEGRRSARRKFLYTMAQLYRDKEDDQDRAVELFNEALDLNPTFLEAFERINKILTAQKDWKAARARVPQDAPAPRRRRTRRTRTSSSTSGTTSASSIATACTT